MWKVPNKNQFAEVFVFGDESSAVSVCEFEEALVACLWVDGQRRNNVMPLVKEMTSERS